MEIGLQPQEFEALEKDYQQFLNELTGDSSLDRFRNEYDKLHKAMKQSYENEKRLIRKGRELNTEIVNSMSKVKQAIQLTQVDSEYIQQMQEELQNTIKMFDLSREREEKNKQKVPLYYLTIGRQPASRGQASHFTPAARQPDPQQAEQGSQ